MIEIEDKELHCEEICNKFNNKTKIWTAKVRNVFTKNMSMYCETILIKENKFFGKRFDIKKMDKELNDLYEGMKNGRC